MLIKIKLFGKISLVNFTKAIRRCHRITSELVKVIICIILHAAQLVSIYLFSSVNIREFLEFNFKASIILGCDVR